VNPLQLVAAPEPEDMRPGQIAPAGALLNVAFIIQTAPRKTRWGLDVTNAQRVKQREEALCAAKTAFLKERTIERLGAVIQAQVEHQAEVEKLLSETQESGPFQ
jgi:hypothetical protein